MKKRVLSGIQPSGKLHLGNYFGMIKRMVEYQDSTDLFCFIANLHSLTTLQNGPLLKELTLNAAIDLLSLGIDPEKTHFWIQSDVPEVTELAWILSCNTQKGLLEKAHSYKDKLSKGIFPNLGLFSYPVLMSADILINRANIVPVGKDQKQHLEIARDIALKFNHNFGNVLTIPEPDILDGVAIIPGTDGQKMSKSYDNTISIFDDPAALKKSVMSIVTDSKGVEDSKDPDACNVFSIYKLFANDREQQEMRGRYIAGGLGYGDAKKILLEKVQNYFSPFKERRKYLANHPEEVEDILKRGAERVRKISRVTLEEVRAVLGLSYAGFRNPPFLGS